MLLVAAVMSLTGCGESHLPATIPVTGTVQFAGGACPGPGRIRFLPVEVAAGLPRRPGRATFEVDGEFEVTSFRPGDGLVPGTYRVMVECWKVEPANGKPGVSYIATGYEPPALQVDAIAPSVTMNLAVPRTIEP